MTCPLCNSIEYTHVPAKTNRNFYKCENCWLIFISPEDYPSVDKEKARYELHENTDENQGYVHFLNKAITPALPHLTHNMHGLDYGCGPQPVLSKLLAEKGITCDNYDPFFSDIELNPPYDFIFSTETFEHFHHPKQEMEKLSQLLKPNGILTIMTDHWQTPEKFDNWYYITDATHVCFYHAKTFNYIKTAYGFTSLYADKERVVILKKQ